MILKINITSAKLFHRRCLSVHPLPTTESFSNPARKKPGYGLFSLLKAINFWESLSKVNQTISNKAYLPEICP